MDVGRLESDLSHLTNNDLALLDWELRWKEKARDKQRPPETEWASWGAMAGRGFGKTLTGASWLGIEAAHDPGSFNAVIAPTLDDVRYTCFEGPTGIIAEMPESLIADYNKSSLIIYLTNGAIIRGFGSERPERLRGPQHHRVWGDELAAWQNARLTYDMMKFGLRLGKGPQFMWTTTPKPLPLVRELVKEAEESGKKGDGKHLIVRGTTYENRDNLAPSFFEELIKYEGTKIGRQELEGELIDPEEDGIVKRSQWRLWPADRPLPRFVTVVMSLDTAYTEKTFDKKNHQPDPSACLTWGLFYNARQLHVMLLDAWDDYLALPKLIERVKAESQVTYGEAEKPLIEPPLIQSKYYKPFMPAGRGVDVILVEDKGSGISLRQMLGMENLMLTPYNPGRADKLARAHEASPMFAHNRVWSVESDKRPGEHRNWAESAISQICSYHGPGTVDNDDYVDCMSQAMKYFMRNYIRSFVRDEIDVREEAEMRDLETEVYGGSNRNPYAS